ncbi:formate/nitrite transporter family protein [Spiroplasma platyhelix]|uniref:Formate/nitrite transporter family protein n=1 Tax=Spiroplasma platyhelix PALS-1 TaxID=1276218 RepID=A0A846U4E1_9MOLU|nr:formate/nitrite transporter family protein [Spiroplasma platyhelix]MBE4703954.1 putative formate transporter 1 [Spiroplasma platyhelix PALS-1]NKE38327.1 formate/nitrite transporter family protein [Spiroplasma platyhelix PALS-1]UJB29212.1 formate/nitrite transporter [Spiroplasma platyhelix PALS-1]
MNNITIPEETRSNKETFVAVYQYALKKAESPLLKTFLMGLASGLFIGIAYIGALYANRGLPDNGIKNLIFGGVFTIAITMIVFMGGEMFTSNSLMFLGVAKKQIKVTKFLLNLLIVLLGNFLGCFILSLFTWWAGFFNNQAFLENAYSLVEHKLEMPWWQAFFSGILCNFLVAGSVYISFATRSSTAKFLLIFLVIFVFALSGFSHVVANSYVWGIIPIFNLFDHPTSFGNFLKFGYQIQLPTLFGNFLGGGILLPGMYYLMFKKELPKTII